MVLSLNGNVEKQAKQPDFFGNMLLKHGEIFFPFVLVQPEPIRTYEDVAVIREYRRNLFSLKEQLIVVKHVVHGLIPPSKQSVLTHGGMSQRLIGIQEV